ncbi:MAG: hypothetical protein R3F65_31775 [bacterium]
MEADAGPPVVDAAPRVTDGMSWEWPPEPEPEPAPEPAPEPEPEPEPPDRGPIPAPDPAPDPVVCPSPLGDAPFAPDYAAASPTFGSHCFGTDHQDIVGVKQVVFLGDDFLIGDERAPGAQMRALIAPRLAARFHITPPAADWTEIDLIDGLPATRRSGDFIVCAGPGARAEELDGPLLTDCLDDIERRHATLVIMQIGLGDLEAIATQIDETVDLDLLPSQLGPLLDRSMRSIRSAIGWLRDRDHLPRGAFVVLVNQIDLTDGTGDTRGCPDWPALDRPRQEIFRLLVGRFNTALMGIAVEEGVDVVLAQEQFCGYGPLAEDPDPICDRDGAREVVGNCRSLMPDGEQRLAELVEAVILE